MYAYFYVCYSEFSPEATFYTSTPPPPAPSSPVLGPPGASSFTLPVCWQPHLIAPSVTYTLEMAPVKIDDPSLTPEELTKRVMGYTLAYQGPDCQYLCTNLLPATAYLFKVSTSVP